MKKSLKKFFSSPFLKSILSFLFIPIGFSLVKFNGTTTVDGLISGLGMVIFFISVFIFSFSVCQIASIIMQTEREEEKKKEKEEKK